MGKYLFAGLLILLLLPPPGSFAYTYDNLIVYGDSLSDTGPTDGDFGIGRFTDGAVWVELLADSLGADMINYAHAWAPTGHGYNPMPGEEFAAFVESAYDGDIGLLWQVNNDAFAVPEGNSLFSVWAGANDLMIDLLMQTWNPVQAALNIGTALNDLYNNGATDFLVGNLPDLGVTPFAQSMGEEALAAISAWTAAFNTQLEEVVLKEFAGYNGVNLYMLDAYSLFASCPDGECPEEMFWIDGLHPAALGHQLIALQAATAMEPVPEPSTFLLLGSGLAGLVFYRRKKAEV